MRARQRERNYGERQANEHNRCGPPEICDRVEEYPRVTLHDFAIEEEWRLDMPRSRHAKGLMGNGAHAGKRMNPHGRPEEHKYKQPGTTPKQQGPGRGSDVVCTQSSALSRSKSQIDQQQRHDKEYEIDGWCLGQPREPSSHA